MNDQLPVAGAAQVRAEVKRLFWQHRAWFLAAAALHVLAALAALVAPAVLGRLVDDVVAGALSSSGLTAIVVVLFASLLLQAALTGAGAWASLVLGERILASSRERFVGRVTKLPLSVVERAGSGDLVTRSTSDIDAFGQNMHSALPAEISSGVSILVTVTALGLTGPLIAAAGLVAVPLLVLTSRWYLHRTGAGYQREMASYAAMNGAVGETADAARTVAALSLQQYRRAEIDARLEETLIAERYTLWLRTIWIPGLDGSYAVLVAGVLSWGGWLTLHGHASAGQVTAVTLYAMQLTYPLQEMLRRLDEFQVGATALARILGVGLVPADRTEGSDRPDSEQITATGVRYAYRPGRDVLHDVDLRLRPGERLAIVGPSGAGKSTLGRLLAGIHPPGAGTVTAGSGRAVPLVDLPLDDLRQRVALVTQEHHVFVGTVAQTLRRASPGASDAELLRALDLVDAAEWAQNLPKGLETVVGSGGYPVPPAWAQQLALARLVLADPHTLVLDEATSLLDPRAARHLERSLSSVLDGRTVVAVAHRLNTAHDADRVAVVEDGRITELGTHDQLIERDGSYAALWRAWRSDAGELAQL